MDLALSEFTNRKRSRDGLEGDSSSPEYGQRETKIFRASGSGSFSPDAIEDVVSSTSVSTDSDDEGDYPDQHSVSETIRSLESELGIQTLAGTSSSSQSDLRDESRLNLDGASCNLDFKDVSPFDVAFGSDLSRSESGSLWGFEDGDLWADTRSCSDRSGSDVLSDSSSSVSKIDFSLLCEVLDEQLGLLQNRACDEFHSFTCHEGDSVCSCQSLAAESYGCTILEEDLWGASSATPEHWGI